MRRSYPIAGPTPRRSTKLVRRLWPNYREVEVDYYRRTGIFPIRHLVVVKDEVLQRDPGVATQLVRAFEDAKQQAYKYWAGPSPLVSGMVRRRTRRGARAARRRSLALLRSRKIKSCSKRCSIMHLNRDSPIAASKSKKSSRPAPRKGEPKFVERATQSVTTSVPPTTRANGVLGLKVSLY